MKRNVFGPLIGSLLLVAPLAVVACGDSDKDEKKKEEGREAAAKERRMELTQRRLKLELSEKRRKIEDLEAQSHTHKSTIQDLREENEDYDERADHMATFAGDVQRLEKEIGIFLAAVQQNSTYLKAFPTKEESLRYLEAMDEARANAIDKVDKVEIATVEAVSMMNGFDGWTWTWKTGSHAGEPLTDAEVQALDLANTKKLINDFYGLAIESLKAHYEASEVELPQRREIPAAGSVTEIDEDTGRVRTLTGSDIARIRTSGTYDVAAFDNFHTIATTTRAPFYVARSAAELPNVVSSVMGNIRAGASRLRPLDIILAIDTTGSMSDDIDAVKTNLRDVVGELKQMQSEGYHVRLGLVVYQDARAQGSEFITKTVHTLKSDLDSIDSSIQALAIGGGGDTPEAVYDALRHANKTMAWARNADRKLILIGDAPGHKTTKSAPIESEDKVLADLTAAGVELVVYPIIVPHR